MNFSRILIISLSNLGDALLTYPALGALREAHPDAEFQVLASPRTRLLFEGDPQFRRVWVWEKKAWVPKQLAQITRLAGQRFDLVVDFRNSLIPLFLPGARRARILRPASGGLHRAAVHLNLLKDLKGPVGRQPLRLPYGLEEEAQVNTWIKPDLRTVVLVPGARSHLKRWGPKGFAEVADRLIQEKNAQILLVGEPAERAISEDVSRAMRGPVTDLTGTTTLRRLAALLARTELMITNDSACLHAAELMGVPTVAIFGPTDERKYGPRHPRSAVVRRTMVCAPCELALCPYGHECMKWIEPAEVYTAAAKILEGGA